MKKETLLKIAEAIKAIAEELGTEATPAEVAASPTPTPEPEKPRGRGRPPKTTEPVAETPAPTPEPETPAAPAPEEPKPTGGKTLEELRKIIEPFVKGDAARGIAPQGNSVKQIITKYAASLTELAPLTHLHAAFEKDIEALGY